MKNENISRRRFIGQSAKVTAGVSLGLAGAPAILKSQSPSEIINVGMIGTGDRGTWEAYILQSVPEVRLIACCDILPSHLQNGLEQATPNAKGYEDYRKLLENDDLDAVIIATPLHLHYKMAVDALDAGLHVFGEKTMTYDIPQANMLKAKVEDSKKTFMVGYQLRSNPLLQKVKTMIDEGACGTLTHVRCNYHRNGDWRREVSDPSLEKLINWRMYREFSGGLMAELCSHHIDITNWMLGEHPKKVTGFGGIDYWKDGRETYDNVNTVYEYPGGKKAIFTSITSNAHYGVELQFMGTHGTIEIHNEEGQEAIYYPELARKTHEVESDTTGVDAVSSATKKAWSSGEGELIQVPNRPKDDHKTTGLAFKHFAKSIKENTQPNANVFTGYDAAVAVHLGNLAMRNGTVESWNG
ncbi:MAG: Gfo/Idh/MocA family oxidoreductase [Candidatus Marinimicrobia bacterium]|nr:Gfo/Idh/MocA family oxidoreductase [Candidatus Neomarinimicrobiota bacterium]MCF7880803.1 Gfo/Idh/MocA family oxidoreductase [Candidatus Neomarinimicrobiota bacterium]